MTSQTFIAIGLASLATYSLRFGGLMLASRLPRSGRFKRGMDALPGALLLSLVAPTAVAEGAWGVGAALLTALVVLRTRNPLIAMLAGMAVILAQRRLGL